MSWQQNLTVIVLQVTLIITFISLFFFFYASKIERDVVITQINSLVDDFTEDIRVFTTSDEQQNLQNLFANMQPGDMSKDDADANETNRELLRKTFVIIGMLCFMGLFYSICMIVFFKVDVWLIFKICFFGLGAVALVEFVFLTYFARNYKSLDPNTVKLTLIKTLRDYANGN
jgi:hypothetical protein